NMVDEAKARGIELDAAALSAKLGVAVVPTVAVRNEGMVELRRAIASALHSPNRLPPVAWPPAVAEARKIVADAARAAGRDCGDADLSRFLFDVEPPSSFPGLVDARASAYRILQAASHDPVSAEALLRYRHIDGLLGG